LSHLLILRYWAAKLSFVLASSSGKNLKDLNLRRAADGREFHAVVAAVSLRLSRIPAMIKLKMTAANSSSQAPILGWMAQNTDEMASIVIGDESRVSFFMNRFRKFGFIDYATPSEGGIQVHSSLFNVVLHD
jgi:hypothetical protein